METKQNMNGMALRLCRRAADEQLTSSEVKLACWLVAAADRLGGFPVEFSYRDIRIGCDCNGVHIAGWSAHNNTIISTMRSLEEKKLFGTRPGGYRGFGHRSKVIFPLSLA